VIDLYQRALVDHAKHPRNFGALPDANGVAQGINPLCGDEVTVRVRSNERIEEIAFEGAGCAICIASASLMTEAAKGLRADEAKALLQRVRAMLAGAAVENLGDLAALAGVAQYPARVKCASLPWSALESALAGRGTVSTEL